MTALEQAKSLFEQGVAQFESGQLEAACLSFEQALILAPGRPSVLLNLGITRMQLGRWEEAVPPLQQSLASQAEQVDGWVALGMALNRLGDLDAALQAYEKVMALAPERALGWGESGGLLREMGRLDEAIAHYERALAIEPEHTLYRYYLSALRGVDAPPHPPQQYVQSLFDQYADDFEPHLVGNLQYQGHSHLIEHLPAQAPKHFPHVLDLGCGSGLCGPLIRPRAGVLWGIDLAQGMIEQSQRLGVYDHLEQADGSAFLAGCDTRWDLVLAADVFIYVGALDELFTQLARRMQPSGWLAFTAELTEPGYSNDRPHLRPSLRYAHPLPYLERMAQAHGFVWRAHHNAPLRLDQGRPLQALYAYLQRA